MKFDQIVADIAHTISLRRKRPFARDIILPVTFTHKYKAAKGCLIFIIHEDGHYEVKKFDDQYMNVTDDLTKVPHDAYYECDDDLERIDEVATAVEQQLKSTTV